MDGRPRRATSPRAGLVCELLIKAADSLLMGRWNESLYPQKLFKLFTVLATSLLKGDYPF